MDKFVTPMPLPTEHERELLTVLIEELAEAAQRATKLLRFGRDEIQPGQLLTNAERLANELGDIDEMVNRCVSAGLISLEGIERGAAHKRTQLAKFLQTSPT
jgi:hypothetical protein